MTYAAARLGAQFLTKSAGIKAAAGALGTFTLLDTLFNFTTGRMGAGTAKDFISGATGFGQEELDVEGGYYHETGNLMHSLGSGMDNLLIPAAAMFCTGLGRGKAAMVALPLMAWQALQAGDEFVHSDGDGILKDKIVDPSLNLINIAILFGAMRLSPGKALTRISRISKIASKKASGGVLKASEQKFFDLTQKTMSRKAANLSQTASVALKSPIQAAKAVWIG